MVIESVYMSGFVWLRREVMIDLKSGRMLSMAMKIPVVGLATAVLAVGAPVGSVVAQTQQQLDAQTQQQLD